MPRSRRRLPLSSHWSPATTAEIITCPYHTMLYNQIGSWNGVDYYQRMPAGPLNTTWDSSTLKEDMEDMWIHPNVNKEWMKSGEKKGKVQFSHDTERRPYLSHVELRAPGMVQ
ncbi:uncharacterized protein [Coffea arabica]|uniref:Uncharacterized protein n=1 Tax=Coffea arabica TaxID=13443 RepID=A0ABM4WK44_COFAR